MTMRTKKLAFAICAITVLALVVYSNRRLPMALPDTEPRGVTITLFEDFTTKEPESTFAMQDKAIIGDLIQCLKTSRGHADHKCGDLGLITIEFASGKERIGFLPGHSPQYYELRHGDRNYRVQRESFIQQLEKCGIPAKRVPTSC